MGQESLSIPQNSLLEILKYQPESVLIELFDSLIINSDTNPLTNEERIEIAQAKTDYNNGDTIKWKS